MVQTSAYTEPTARTLSMSIAYHLCRASWQTIHKSPELFFSLAILMVWSTLSAPTRPLGLWIGAVLVVPLCYYGYRLLGATPWMKRLGWIAPPRTFWAGSLAAGFVLALAIVVVARTVGQPLGTVHSIRLVLLATTVGPLLEELFFRGLLYWALHKAMRHLGLRPGIVYPLTVTILGVLFAFAHTGAHRFSCGPPFLPVWDMELCVFSPGQARVPV